MKKAFAIILTLALLVAALAVTAMAEESAAQNIPQMTARGGRQQNGQMPGNNGQMPQMPGNGRQNGQMPQMPGSGTQNGQMPQMPGNNGQQPAAPAAGTDTDSSATQAQQPFSGKAGRNNRFGRGGITFEALLQAGVIDQTTYDAIIAYMKENAPAVSEQAAPADAQAPEAPAEGTPDELPELPAGATEGDLPGMPAGTLLKDLLDSGVITQEQYDVLSGAQADLPMTESETAGE